MTAEPTEMIILRGGPQDGWVYNLQETSPETPRPLPHFIGMKYETYEETEEYETREDGERLRVYRFKLTYVSQK